MPICDRCGALPPDWATFCTNCGFPVALPSPETVQVIVHEVERWAYEGLIDADTATRIRSRYVGMTAPRQAPSAPPPAVPHPSQRGSATVIVRPAAPQPAAPEGAWVTEFLEAHWLKLSALVAALLVFAGLRQVLGSAWASQIAITFLPLLPTGLMAAALWVGRTSNDQEIGAFAFPSIGIVLAFFVVGSVNKNWLGGALEPFAAYGLGAACSTVTAALVGLNSRDERFSHYVLAGIPTSAALLVQAFWPAETRALGHVVLLAVLASVYASLAARQDPEEAGPAPRAMLVAWSCAVAVAAALWTPGRALFAEGSFDLAGAIVVLAMAAVFGAAAHSTSSTSLASMAAAAAALAGYTTAASASGPSWHGCAFVAAALATLCGVAALAYGAAGDEEERGPLASTYGALCGFSAGLAGALALVATLHPYFEVSSTSRAYGGWILLWAAAGYAAIAAVSGRQRIHYAAAAALTLAGLSLGDQYGARLAPMEPLIPGRWVMPPAALLGVAGVVLAMVNRGRPRVSEAADAYLTAGAGAAWLCVMLAAPAAGGRHAEAWGHVAGGVAVLCMTAWLLQRSAVSFAVGSAVAVSSALIASAMAGGAAYPFRLDPWIGTFAGGALAAAAMMVVSDLASAAKPERQWPTPATAVACLAALVAVVAVAGGVAWEPHFYAPWPRERQAELLLAATAAVYGLLAGFSRGNPWAGGAVAVAAGLAACLLGAYGLIGQGSAPAAAAGAVVAALGLWRAARRHSSDALYAGWAALWPGISWLLARSSADAMPWAYLAVVATCAAVYAWAEWRTGSVATCQTAPALSVAVAAACTGVSALDGPAGAPHLLAAGAFALLAAWAMARRRTTAWALLTSAAWLLLAVKSVQIGADQMGLRAVLLAGAGGIFAATAVACRNSGDRWEFALPAALAGCVAAEVAALGVGMQAATADEGPWMMVTCAMAGSVFVGIRVTLAMEAFQHAAVGCFALGYWLMLYDRTGVGAGWVDFYLIPVGIYLAVLGHVAAHEGKQDRCAALWWAGALMVLTPTFVAFMANNQPDGSPVHALLLLVECTVGAAWGIARRIRAFVLAGAMHATAFAVVIGVGAASALWAGLMALVVGLTILAAILYLTRNRERLEAYRDKLAREWENWR
ncbi:MAG: hypothetical protein NT029_20865 [Armatimonadetes bacterium]|nr:hypothetical protein [Armatimonadota bacterium]